MSQRSVHILDQFLHDLGTGKSPDLESAARSLHETDRGDMLPIMIRRHAIQARQSGREPVLEEYQFASEWLPLDRLQDLIKTNNADLKEEIETNLRSAWDTSQRTRDGVVEPPPNLLPIDSLSWMPPNKIGKFEIGSVLGRGSFGIVLEGTDAVLNRRVAIKIPRDATRSHADFVAEARANASLSHPSVIPLLEFGTDSELGIPFLVFPFVEGGDLGRMIEKSAPLSPSVAARLIIDIAGAIQHAHSRDLYHRDLKPRNILIDTSGRAFVSDFGLSIHVAAQRKQRNEIAGTPAYMAPEQIRGETESLDGRSDVWALGVILYELLGNRRPFKGETSEELRSAILNHSPRPLTQFASQVPTELDELCRRCLKRSPEDRFASSGELASALQSWLADYEDTRVSRKVEPNKPNRSTLVWRYAAAAVILAIVALALAVPAMKSSPLPPPPGFERLLKAEPEYLAWPVDSKLTHQALDLQAGRLHLASDNFAIAKIATDDVGTFRLQANCQSFDSGRCGFVWGWQEKPNDPATRICQALYVQDYAQTSEQTDVMLIWADLEYNTQMHRFSSTFELGGYVISELGKGPNSLHFRIEGGQPTDITWRGKPIAIGAPSPKFYKITPQKSIGAIGFLVEKTSAMIDNVSISHLK